MQPREGRDEARQGRAAGQRPLHDEGLVMDIANTNTITNTTNCSNQYQ